MNFLMILFLSLPVLKSPARTCRISIAFDCTGRYGVAHGEAVEIRIAFHEPDYYTVFYNDEEQMELEKRTDLNQVDVEQPFGKRLVKTCRFQRLKGEWRLTQESIRDFTTAEPLDKFMDFTGDLCRMPPFSKEACRILCATSRQTPMMISIR